MAAKTLTVGTIVTWREPLDDNERQERFVLIELNGDRCFIRAICNLPLPPIGLACIDDLIPADSGEIR